MVERTSSGYHVILPAHLEWAASVPNPTGRAVEITPARGIACWDLKTRGVSGCGGPFGSKEPAGIGFLAAESGAGNLIMRTRDGHIWFSVNGRSGAFQENQGFYEFDLEIR